MHSLWGVTIVHSKYKTEVFRKKHEPSDGWLEQVKFNPFLAAEETQPVCTVWVIGYFFRWFPEPFCLCPCPSKHLQGEVAPCPVALLALQFARCKYEVRGFDWKREAWTYLCILLWTMVKWLNLFIICKCWKRKGNNCRVEIKGKLENRLCIHIVSPSVFGEVLSSGYETMPCICSCHFWFANLMAEWQVTASPPWQEHPCSLSSAATAGSLSRACPLSEEGRRHWSDDMCSRSTKRDDLVQWAGRLCHSDLWQGT